MLYYTQLIFIKEGMEECFQEFENKVLPLLKKHEGELLYRLRPSENNVLHTSVGHPYEIHLVRFPSAAHFENYKCDDERRQSAFLKDQSVANVLLIEGRLL